MMSGIEAADIQAAKVKFTWMIISPVASSNSSISQMNSNLSAGISGDPGLIEISIKLLFSLSSPGGLKPGEKSIISFPSVEISLT